MVCQNAPLDVIEGYAWGHEWLLGTYKHPPMQAWWLEFFEFITFRSTWAHFLASQAAIGLALWAVWKTGLRIVEPVSALLGVLLLEGVIYYNFTSPEFNPNVLQICFWALIGMFYHRAVKDGRLIDWLWLGVASAGGMYSKYSTILLLASLFLLTLARPESRRRFRDMGPYLTLVTTMLLFAPHIWWLLHNDFIPFDYARERMHTPKDVSTIKSVILIPVFFIGSQILAVLPALLMSVGLVEPRDTNSQPYLKKFDRDFLITVTFGPCLLILVANLFFGLNIHDMWAMPFWNFIGLWGLSFLNPTLSEGALRRFIYSFMLIAVTIVIGYIGSIYFYPYITGKALRVHFPGHMLAKTIDRAWFDRFHEPLPYITGDMWPAGNIAFYAPQRVHVFLEANPAISAWIDSKDVERKGSVMVWCIRYCRHGNYEEGTPDYVKNNPKAEIQTPLMLQRLTNARIPPVTIGWAIVPPQP